jgi:hypothetical protein
VVVGRLRVISVPAYTINGEWVEPFWQLRLEAARPVRDREDDD